MKKLLGLLLLLAGVAQAATVHVSWTNPTQYTDGSSLPPADITQSRIEWGSCNGTAFGTKIAEQIVPGNVTSGDINLAPATYCIRVYTTAKGVESGPSNVASKNIVQPQPKPPVLLTVDITAFEIKPNNTVKFAGLVAKGVECRSTTQTVNGITYTELDPATVTFKNPGTKPAVVWGKCEEKPEEAQSVTIPGGQVAQ